MSEIKTGSHAHFLNLPAKAFKMKYNHLVLISLVLLFGCQSNEPAPIQVTPGVVSPVITSISPTSGPFDTEVTISGTGFGETIANNFVTVNGKSAEVILATSTSVKIKIPLRAGTGPIVLETLVDSADGPVFTYSYTVTVTTLAGQAGLAGNVIGDATVSKFNLPSEIKVGSDGNIYVSDRLNNCIKKVTPAGITSLYTGQSASPGGTNGDISVATYTGPNGIGYDKNGNTYLAEVSGCRIRKITSGGIVSTLAGTGIPGYVNGNSSITQFDTPQDCAIDNDLNIYVPEFGNNTIRKLSPSGESITLAGDGTPGFADGTGSAARFTTPTGIVIDLNGDFVVADFGNHRIRKVTAAGVVTTIAGNGTPGLINNPAGSAQFTSPRDVTVDADGNIYIADSGNHAIRMLTTSGVITLAGNGTSGSTNGSGAAARFNFPYGIDVAPDGTLYVADRQNHLVRKIVVN